MIQGIAFGVGFLLVIMWFFWAAMFVALITDNYWMAILLFAVYISWRVERHFTRTSA